MAGHDIWTRISNGTVSALAPHGGADAGAGLDDDSAIISAQDS